MLPTIEKDHEIICRNCGCVVGTVEESHEVITPMSTSPNLFLLGTAIQKHIKYSYNRTRQDIHEEKVLRQLESVVKHYGLPEVFITDTFNEMKRKNRGFRSEIEPIKQLLKILSKDDNYIYIHKYRAIKARYEDILNH